MQPDRVKGIDAVGERTDRMAWRSSIWRFSISTLAGLLALTGCLSPTPAATLSPQSSAPLTVAVLYPTRDATLEMGQQLRVVVQVRGDEGSLVSDARVTLSLVDTQGRVIQEAELEPGEGPAYRSPLLEIPHRQHPGLWQLLVNAQRGRLLGQARATFDVHNSTSEYLLDQYGFWLNAPTLHGILPQVVAERGDAENGMVRWGGSLPGQHVFPENWIEVHWRRGEYPLQTSQEVRRFLLEEVGDIGFTPIRDLGPFVKVRFDGQKAWRVGARGQYVQIDEEWIVYYAREADRTYAIATTVVLPPVGIDAHAALRESFAILNAHATGIAPEPLPHLRPAPELITPAMGAAFVGADVPVILQWSASSPLAQDEYFEVRIDWNDREANPFRVLTTRDEHLQLPGDLLQQPNCHVFNWQVRVMRRTGISEEGQTSAAVMSYGSLYRYLFWWPASGEAEGSASACPNAQY